MKCVGMKWGREAAAQHRTTINIRPAGLRRHTIDIFLLSMASGMEPRMGAPTLQRFPLPGIYSVALPHWYQIDIVRRLCLTHQ